jgi:acyl carrier protein
LEFEKIREVIAAQMGIDEDEITPDTTFVEDLGADSIDVYQIISDLEETFEMEFSNEDAESIKSIKDVVDYIRNARK